MKYIRFGKGNEIYKQFFESNFIDFFIKDIILIILKSVIYFFIIWDTKTPFSKISFIKRALIILISLVAWVFKFVG